MPFRVGPTELIIILVIIMIIFGVGKLPEIGSALGKGIREFRKAQSGAEEVKESLDVSKELSESKVEGEKDSTEG